MKGLNVNDQVDFLTNCIKNIFKNFVPNKLITIKEKDAPWITPEIKRILPEKTKEYKKYVKSGRNEVYANLLRNITNKCSSLIHKTKVNYYTSLGNKLNDPTIGSKKYWSILNKFIKRQKIPSIPPINEGDLFITNISDKASLFNNYFAKQCTLINTPSVLPGFKYSTNYRIESINFTPENIVSLIRNLNPNKAHGWDGVSARMLKICDKSIVPPLLIIFKNSLETGIFPSTWKKENIVPVHKKQEKTLIKNYRPISLLPIMGKLLEKCIYDSIYSYFEKNEKKWIIFFCQSGFRKNDSCVSQLLAITHEIFSGFNSSPSRETRGIFLDISKAFDKVWHKGLLFKLKTYGIQGQLLKLIKNFLTDRLQKVVLSGQSSDWKSIFFY